MRRNFMEAEVINKKCQQDTAQTTLTSAHNKFLATLLIFEYFSELRTRRLVKFNGESIRGLLFLILIVQGPLH